MELHKIDLAQLTEWTKSIVSQLFFEKIIVSKWSNKTYLIEDLELYVYHDTNPDLFAHRSELQQRHGFWYFHQAPSGSDRSAEIPARNKLRGGTRKGLDITLGNNSTGVHAGALIRSIRPFQSDSQSAKSASLPISGPCLVVHELLQLTALSSSEEYSQKAQETDSENSMLILEDRIAPLPSDHHIHSLLRGPRVNLTLSKHSPTLQDLQFVLSPLRFSVRPDKYLLSLIAQQLLDGKTEQFLQKFFSSRQISKSKTLMTLGRQFGLDSHLKNLRTMDDKKATMAMGFVAQLDRE